MTVHVFPISDKRSGKRLWLVSAGGGRQLRGVEGETLIEMREQWERTWGKIGQLKKEKECTLAQAEATIEQMRKAFLERRDKT